MVGRGGISNVSFDRLLLAPEWLLPSTVLISSANSKSSFSNRCGSVDSVDV